jgi:hypothetical protein
MVFRAEQLRKDAETPVGGPTVPTVNLGPHSHDAPPESERGNIVENVPGGLMDGDNVQAAFKAKEDTRSAAEKTGEGLHPNAAVDSDGEARAVLESSAAEVSEKAKEAAVDTQRRAVEARDARTETARTERTTTEASGETVEQATAAPGEKRATRREG